MLARLRELTSAGLLDCKKALVMHDYDFDRAVEFLRTKGLAIVIKPQKKPSDV
jgi:elongation factor Ts